MVELTENDNIRKFQGKVTDLTTEEANDKYPAQYKLTIQPTNKEYKNQYLWISIPRTSTNTTVPKKSLLGFIIQRLETFGIKEKTHKETIEAMINKNFEWTDENPKIDGENLTKKDKLLPQKILK